MPAGRKLTGSRQNFMLHRLKKEYLKSCLISFRKRAEEQKEKFEEHMEKIGQQTLPLGSQEPAEASKAYNRYNSLKKK